MPTFNSLVTVKVTRQWLHLMIFSWFIFAWCDWIWLIVLNCFSHTPHCMHFSKCVCRCRYSIVRDLNSLLHILHVGIRSGVFCKCTKWMRKWFFAIVTVSHQARCHLLRVFSCAFSAFRDPWSFYGIFRILVVSCNWPVMNPKRRTVNN